MVNEQERTQLNHLKREIEAKENHLKSEQYLFEQKLKNGLGEEIIYTLSNSGIYNNKGDNKPNIITRIKNMFKKRCEN